MKQGKNPYPIDYPLGAGPSIQGQKAKLTADQIGGCGTYLMREILFFRNCQETESKETDYSWNYSPTITYSANGTPNLTRYAGSGTNTVMRLMRMCLFWILPRPY